MEVRHDIEDITRQQARERAWWDKYPVMRAVGDFDAAVNAGRAVRMPDAGYGYRVAYQANPHKGVKPTHRVLENKTARMLEHVARQWLLAAEQAGVNRTDGVKGTAISLIVTSMARTLEDQESLVSRGFPAVREGSTHTKLGAFDLHIGKLKQYPQLLAILDKILSELHESGRINWIRETHDVYHIAAFPGGEG